MSGTSYVAIDDERRVLLDEQGLVAEDLPCLRCGYNLRTLAPQRECVECGLPIIDSASRNRLRLASVSWLKTIRSGILKMVLVWILGIVVTGLFSVLLALQAITLPQMRLLGLATIPVSLLAAWAWWQIGEPEPKVDGDAWHPDPFARSAMRWVGLASVALAVIEVSIHAAIGPTLMQQASPSGLLGMVALMLLCFYFAGLSERAGKPGPGRQFKVVGSALVVGMSLMWAMTLVMNVWLLPRITMAGVSTTPTTGAPMPATSGLFAAVGLINCGVGVLLLATFVWLLVLLAMFWRMLQGVIRARA